MSLPTSPTSPTSTGHEPTASHRVVSIAAPPASPAEAIVVDLAVVLERAAESMARLETATARLDPVTATRAARHLQEQLRTGARMLEAFDALFVRLDAAIDELAARERRLLAACERLERAATTRSDAQATEG